MDTRPMQAPEARKGKLPRGVMQRLLDSLRRRAAWNGLPPPGRRSGNGADSLEPYLEQTRSTRPSPLE